MKVTAILKGRIDTNGQRPIQVRIFNNGKNYYRPTHIKVLPTQFKNGRVVDHPKAQEWNDKIKNLIIQYQAQALQEPEKKQPKVYLFDYINTCMNKWDKIKKWGTLRIYNSQLEKLKGFTPNVLLTQIDNNFLYAYQSYLLKLGNSQNTVWSSFKFLRTILNDAVKNDLLDKSPFRKFTMPKYEDPNKTYLLPDELKKIDKFLLDKKCPEELFFVGAWFLIGCNTGMRLSDQKAFDRKKNIHSDRLVIKTAKTGELVGLPIDTALKKLFERVNYKPMHYTGEQYNRLLKLVIMGAGIDKKVSTHIGRHTFSMRLANSGVSQEVTAKILGHADLRSTASYYKITNLRVDNEMKKVTGNR
jgi:site-specific recombinase XerD